MGRPSRLRPRARSSQQPAPRPLLLSLQAGPTVVLRYRSFTPKAWRGHGAPRGPSPPAPSPPTRARGRPQTLALLLLSSQPPPLPSPPSPRRFSEHQQQRAAVSCRAWRRRPSRRRSRAVAGMEPPSIHLRPRQISGPEMH